MTGFLQDIRGVIFDMDGTLTRPVIDFALMRGRLGLPAGDILAAIRAMPPDGRQRAFAVIEEIEADARARMDIQPGAPALLRLLETRGIERALLTRNTHAAVRRLQELLPVRFSAVITRDFHACKPDPEPALHIARLWNLKPAQILLVGDFRDDLLCGRQARTRTCLLLDGRNEGYAPLADFTITALAELTAAFEQAGLPAPAR